MGNITETGLKFILPDAVEGKKVSTIEVGPFAEAGLAQEINKFLETEIEELTRINTYVLVHPAELTGIDSLLLGKPFVDPIVHRATLNSPLISELEIPFDFVLQSNYNKGTSDADGDTALNQTLLALEQALSEGDSGYYAKQYFLTGNLNPGQLEEVSGFLANPNLNERLIVSRKEYFDGISLDAPIVLLEPEVKVQEYDVVSMSDEELIGLSNTRKLAATLEEMQQFRDMYKDEKFLEERRKRDLTEKATDVELETWFGLRSEHCFHKELNARITLDDTVNDPIFKMALEKGWLTNNDDGSLLLEDGLFKTFIEKPARDIYAKLEKRGKNWIADMFRDNAGTVFYNEDYMFCIKFETHNSPTNKEPIQGAKTGIDGVNRDTFANMLGTFDAIANFFGYFMANPDYEGWLPKGVKHPYVLLKGATQGVREGGNESQIATLGGAFGFDPRSIAKCLLYAGTVGWSPVWAPDGTSYLEKHPSIGDIMYVVGTPVGRDGIHGSTESSLIADAYISLGHVQADYSFEQAKWKEWSRGCARDNLFTTIGDCGAMGIGVSLELAKGTNGLIIDLGLHPRKYAGIQPWEVACSETQDREVPGSKPEDKDELFRRAKLQDVRITEIGEFTDTGYTDILWDGKTVGLIDLERLDNKEPRKEMHATWNGPGNQDEPEINGEYSFEETLCMVMSQPDVASKEWFFRQKDTSVKGGTIQGPLIGLNQEVEADATIQKPLDTEGLDFGAIAYALGINPKLSDIDAYYSAQKSYMDMIGKIVAVGGALPDMEEAKWDAWAVCGNYCQPNSESKTTLLKENGEHNLASFVREGIAIREAEEETNIPVISGKDSMKCSCVYEVDDDFKLENLPLDLRRHVTLVEEDGKRQIEIHDPDSYLASCAVKIEDYRKCVNSALKRDGDLIYIVGTTKNELGASQYLSAVGYEEDGAPKVGGAAPKIDYDEFKSVISGIHESINDELVASCSYIHMGGIAAALTKAAFAGELGADIDTRCIVSDENSFDHDVIMYSETPGRFIVTVDKADSDEFDRILSKNNVPYSCIGEVTDNNTITTEQGNADLSKVKEEWKKPLRFDLDVAMND